MAVQTPPARFSCYTGAVCDGVAVWVVWVMRQEFVVGLSAAIHAPMESKMQFMFKAFDKDGSGSIDVAELVDLLETGWRQSESCANFFDDVRVCVRGGRGWGCIPPGLSSRGQRSGYR